MRIEITYDVIPTEVEGKALTKWTGQYMGVGIVMYQGEHKIAWQAETIAAGVAADPAEAHREVTAAIRKHFETKPFVDFTTE